MLDLKWSHTEKVVARRAFDLALQREFASLVREVKQRASRIQSPKDLWELERWLSDCREDIGQTYDYRYSVLPIVFARLLCKGTLSEGDLTGLRQDKIDSILRGAEALRL
jgi:hypothetical protein